MEKLFIKHTGFLFFQNLQISESSQEELKTMKTGEGKETILCCLALEPVSVWAMIEIVDTYPK